MDTQSMILSLSLHVDKNSHGENKKKRKYTKKFLPTSAKNNTLSESTGHNGRWFEGHRVNEMGNASK